MAINNIVSIFKKMNHGLKVPLKVFMVTVEHLLWRYKGRRLSRVEYHILNGAREDQTYKQIAEKFRYSFKYVTSVV